ncbi:MAG: hypothetical protein ACRC5T_10305, partial [Cetobacterium sp.]
GIKVDGRKGKWYVIDKRVVKDMNGRIKTVFMLEHEFYGDEAEWIFVDSYAKEIEQFQGYMNLGDIVTDFKGNEFDN